jgi:heme oxygenase
MYCVGLKSRTKPLHDRVEQHPLLAAQLAPEVTLQDYSSALALLHSLHSSLEPQIFALLDAKFIERSRIKPRRTALDQDLSDLGAAPLEIDEFTHIIGDQSVALGACYVLEGSALGGKAILMHLRKKLATPSHPLPQRFYDFYGTDLAAHWARFRTELDNFASHQDLEFEQLLAGAQLVYQSLIVQIPTPPRAVQGGQSAS